MNEQSLSFIIFIVLLLAFCFGGSAFYNNINYTKKMNMDNFSWQLISLALASVICSFIWNHYTNKYV